MTGQPAATPAASGVPPLSVAEDSKATSSPSAGLLQVCSSEKQSLALPATPLQVSDRPCQPAMLEVARGPETAPVLSGAAPATGSLAPDAAPQPGSSASVHGGPAAVLQQKGGEASGRSSVLNAALELQVAMGSKLPKSWRRMRWRSQRRVRHPLKAKARRRRKTTRRRRRAAPRARSLERTRPRSPTLVQRQRTRASPRRRPWKSGSTSSQVRRRSARIARRAASRRVSCRSTRKAAANAGSGRAALVAAGFCDTTRSDTCAPF